MTQATDESLMQMVKEGKLQCMEVLFHRYKRPLFNYFLKCTFSKLESEDLTQMVFVKVISYRSSYGPGKEFRLWLFSIARNLLMDHFQRLKVQRERYDIAASIPDLPDVNQQKVQQEQEERLYNALESLPNEKRELLVLSKFEKMKYEDLAQLRNTTVAAIKVQVHRAVAMLRQVYFDNQNNGEDAIYR